MSAPVIAVSGLSKTYRLGSLGAGTLREEISGWFRRLRGQAAANDGKDFCALSDVSFTVQPGEVVGVIGRNGAGKSTLLKILSRVTEPTSGRAVLRGRVGSLLEVGTGFHPDLSGRDNIYLNGAILGMKRAEIRAKFDEIVAFAEVDQFIDTPVKRYSSGMYVRLAFAVAAHLEPEILIVDEVLAVGDAQFQAKCMGKMRAAARDEGRTVLFVSHQMGAVASLCSRAIALTQGRVVNDGPAGEVLRHYLTSSNDVFASRRDLRSGVPRRGTGEFKISEVELSATADGTALPMPRMSETLQVRFLVERHAAIPAAQLRLAVSIRSTLGQKLIHVCNEDDDAFFPEATKAWFTVSLPALSLYPGGYVLSLWVGSSTYQDYDYIEECLAFEVSASIRLKRAFKTDLAHGAFLHASQWAVRSAEAPQL